MRLSAASNIDYSRAEPVEQHRLMSDEGIVSPSEADGTETPMEPSIVNVNAIPIPTSPRPFLPNYQRSSSLAQRRALPEDGDILSDSLRPASLGASQKQPRHSNAVVEQGQDTGASSGTSNTPANLATMNQGRNEFSPQPSSLGRRVAMRTSNGGDGAEADSASGGSFGHNAFRSRLPRGRGRGSFPSHDSSPSFEGSTGAGGEREGENGTGIVDRRGRRPTFGSNSKPDSKYDEDEPFLFQMSDIGASRRSLEEATK